jgi:hypothetical protein
MESGAKPVQPTEAATAPESEFERLKAKHRKVRRNRKPLELEIPGYDGSLVAKYRVPSIPEIQARNAKVAELEEEGDEEAVLHVAMDNIAQTCVGIYLRALDGELVPLSQYKEEWGNEPVRYDSRLAEFFEVDATSAREIISDRFPEDLAIIDHSARINIWVAGGTEGEIRDF